MLQNINFPEDLKYASDRKNNPLQFYLSCLKNSKTFDLRLGYFSSAAIRVLSFGFARFIYNDGVFRLIINQYLSEDDKKAIFSPLSNDDYKFIDSEIIKEPEKLYKVLSEGEKHFFNCLRYLVENKRLIIQPVKMRTGCISHYKEGIFSDGKDQVYFNGSCNFTYNGLVENGESISIQRSWGYNPEVVSIQNSRKEIESIFSKKDSNHIYLSEEDIISVIMDKSNSKNLDELIQEEENIISIIKNHKFFLENNLKKELNDYNIWLKKEINKPKFPYKEPRNYQKNAYSKWVENDYKGIFAMATGTGKTITSLNCLLNEYKKSGYYRAIILVPTVSLVEQWTRECHKFNFKNIITISSKRPWDEDLATTITSTKVIDTSFIIIATYSSFSKKKFQSYFKSLPYNTLFIADEAHNLGSKSLLKLLPSIRLNKRIGLSATPDRYFDDVGNSAIQDFFEDKTPYIVSFSMKEALDRGWLCPYTYYPHFVHLTEDEMDKYEKISRQLIRMGFYDANTNTFKSTPQIEMKLLERKRIIHKAQNKIIAFKRILHDEYKKRGNLKYTLVYVPEGKDETYENKDYYIENDYEHKLIDKYTKAVSMTSDEIMVSQFTSETTDRQALSNYFERGEIDVLTSMKCLDEGVDLPRSELAIFCASTGNPRQFIQRRGRVLRLHKDKIHSVIHDLVVIPTSQKNSETFQMERNLIINELKRVVDFSTLAINRSYTFKTMSETLDKYNINIFKL